jgi:hypothetical protein
MTQLTPGVKVLVEFNTAHWPIHKATYIYEGRDETGWWVRRKDGVQRYFAREDVVAITPVADEEIPEAPH